MLTLNNFICVIHDVLSEDICDALLSEYVDSKEWSPAKTVVGVNINVRNCDTIKMSTPESIQLNKDKRIELDNEILKSLSKTAKSYFEKFPRAMCTRDTGYELLRYNEGGFFKEHVDYSHTTIERQVSFSFGLNNNYIGGEFKFAGDNNTYKVPKGSCIAFPSNFVFPHQILPVTSGTRYSVVTWMY
jgi:predicted 2-oxoglutarate/Fe(II)-dependent dioxygenase YbiX